MTILAYGYMRVLCETDDEIVRGMEKSLRGFAEFAGMTLASIFYDYQSGSYSGFEEMVQELERTDTHHVVVPSTGHISASPIICNHLLARLALEAEAEVHELDET